MNFKNILLALSFLLLLACGKNEPGATSAASDKLLNSLPATVEGVLVLDVSEGDGEFGDYTDFNFGTLTIGTEDVLVEASGEVVRNLKLPDDGGRVRVTISSKSGEGYMTMYKISSVQRL